MHRIKALAGGITAAWLSAAVLVAQSQSSTTSTTQSSSKPAGERVTVTGCIERADQFNQAGANTLGTTVDSLDFVLIRAQMGNAAAAGRGSTASPVPSGTSGTENAVGPMYRLDGRTEQLNPHVGHRVEIVGMREGTAKDAASAQAANTTNPSIATAPFLHVESVKMVSDTCPR